jgi:hypothetical protein
MAMKPKIVAEGQHIRYTPQGIVLAGEFSRAIVASCLECSHQNPLRLVADEPLDDNECDRILTEYLDGLGWDCEQEGDVCPDCAAHAE